MTRKPLLCDRCRVPLEPGKHIYSRFTGNHYCFSLKDCERHMRNELTNEEIVRAAAFWKNQLDSMPQ